MSKILKAVVLQTAPIVIKNYTVPLPLPLKPVAEVITPPRAHEESLAAAQAKAAQIVSAAETEADQILADARQQINELQQQAADLEQQAQEAGYKAGYQQGYDEGTVQGRQDVDKEMQAVLADARNQAQQTLLLAQQEAKTMIIDAERDIVDLALAIARKILAREIEENPLVVLPIVKAALDKVRDQDEVTIRVSPSDFDLVLKAKHDLQIMIGRSQAITVKSDDALTVGSCIIETNYGTVDARVESQLENLKSALHDVMP